MIRIIKHGNKRRSTCPNCGCVFEFGNQDITVRNLGRNEFNRYINCPECEEEIVVE